MNFALDHSTKIILRVVAVLLILGLLWVVRDIVIIVLLALVLASAMEPMVDYLHHKKVPRFVSVLGAYAIVIGFVVLMASLLAPTVINQGKLLSENLPQYAQELQARYPGATFLTGGVDFVDIAEKLIVSETGSAAIFDRTLGLFNGVVALITVLVVSFYMVAADRGMKNMVGDLVPTQYQDRVLRLISKIQHRMGWWVVGQVILSVFIFALTFIGLTILGVDYALFLAIIAGLLEVVPYIGPFMAAIPAVFFALIQNPPLVIGVIILYILIQKIEGYVIVPKVMQKTVGTSPLVVLLALLVGYKLAGILGILLAVPMASAITVIIHEFFPARPKQISN